MVYPYLAAHSIYTRVFCGKYIKKNIICTFSEIFFTPLSTIKIDDNFVLPNLVSQAIACNSKKRALFGTKKELHQ